MKTRKVTILKRRKESWLRHARAGRSVPGKQLLWTVLLAIAGGIVHGCVPTDLCACSEAIPPIVVYGQITSSRGPVADVHLSVADTTGVWQDAGFTVETRSDITGHFRLEVDKHAVTGAHELIVKPLRRSGLADRILPLALTDVSGQAIDSLRIDVRLDP